MKTENIKSLILQVVDTAKSTYINAGVNVANHIADVSNMVSLGSNSQREVADIMLTRYAACLLAQNGDPQKRRNNSM